MESISIADRDNTDRQPFKEPSLQPDSAWLLEDNMDMK